MEKSLTEKIDEFTSENFDEFVDSWRQSESNEKKASTYVQMLNYVVAKKTSTSVEINAISADVDIKNRLANIESQMRKTSDEDSTR